MAIIALIATPIILGIINDAREKANERSVELYASAVRNAVAAYQLTNANAPTSFSDLTIQYDGDVVCSVQELYEDGSFYLEGCKVNNGEKEYSYGIKQGTTIEVGKMSICNPLNVRTKGVYTAGDKYECDVDPNKEGYDHTFYILTTPEEGATSINLIMDRNICEDGNEATENNTCVYAYTELGDAAGTGPVTAMAKLNAATSKWDNVLSLNITYDDEGGNFENFALTGKARLPYHSEVNVYDFGVGEYAYLYNNLTPDNYYCYNIGEEGNEEEVSCDEAENIEGVYKEGMTHILGIDGYWTFDCDDSVSAWCVCSDGYLSYSEVSLDNQYGVRPVINLSI